MAEDAHTAPSGGGTIDAALGSAQRVVDALSEIQSGNDVDPETLLQEIGELQQLCASTAAQSQLREAGEEQPEWDQGSTDGDRRRHGRFLDDVREVKVMLKQDARVFDESYGGIKLAIRKDVQLQVGQQVEVMHHGAPIKATVQWTRDHDIGQQIIGLQWA